MRRREMLRVLMLLLCLLFAGCSASQGEQNDNSRATYIFPIPVGSRYEYVDQTGRKIAALSDTENPLNLNTEYPVLRSPYECVYVNRENKVVLDLRNEIEAAKPFSEGLSPVKKNGKWGYIDALGNIAIDFQFDEAELFSEGLAEISDHSIMHWVRGYIDKQGEIVVKPQYQFTSPFSDGMARVGRNISSSNNPIWGYINTLGKVIMQIQYYLAEDFSEGYAYVSEAYPVRQGEEPMFMDKNGERAFEQYFAAGSFSEGLAAFQDPQTNLIGYIDLSGRIAVEPEYFRAYPFKDGMAAVQLTENSPYGFIEKNGRLAISSRFSDLSGPLSYTPPFFSHGLAWVVEYVGSRDGKTVGKKTEGWIDKTGKYVWKH